MDYEKGKCMVCGRRLTDAKYAKLSTQCSITVTPRIRRSKLRTYKVSLCPACMYTILDALSDAETWKDLYVGVEQEREMDWHNECARCDEDELVFSSDLYDADGCRNCAEAFECTEQCFNKMFEEGVQNDD